jgi:hypothetical protein
VSSWSVMETQAKRIIELEAESESWRQLSEANGAEAGRRGDEVMRLREDYEAMRLEWSKSVDERDEALAEVKRLREELRVADEDHEQDEKVLREATDALLKAYDQSGLVDLRWFVPYMEALRTARTPDTEGEQ